MRRVSVIGSSTGSGKTTFGRALAARLGVEFTELDALFWHLPGWRKPDPRDFQERVRRIAARDAWVIDGNYSAYVREIVWSRADTVVWLDPPLPVSLARMLRRTFGRIRRRESLFDGSNRETWRNAFLSPNSLLVYALRTHRGRVKRIERELESPLGLELGVHRFRSGADAGAWLARVAPVDPNFPNVGGTTERV